jgi:lipopolysaccharide/colanic/teichoic acid biosynthesis glycosyltransferase
MQRLFDIIFSAIALVFLFPLLLPLSLFLRMTGEGEVFYLQERIGKNGMPFKLYKFATMIKDSPLLGTGTVTVKNDPRILPAGKLLRKTKINELPQLLNILFGNMSVIGPRPLTKQTFDAYSAEIQQAIVKVRPGLSGVGSVVFRGEEDILAENNSPLDFYKNTIAPYKGRLEIWYVENNTLINYFKTILLTIVVVLFPQTRVVWRTYHNLPLPPDELKDLLNFPKFAK